MRPPASGGPDPDGRGGTVAVVVVTFNRADLLAKMLRGLAAQERRPDAVYVVDNASSDHTRAVLEAALARGGLRLHPLYERENLGGAGGFHRGVREAHRGGWDRIWLMDDDVLPAPDCLAVLMATPGDCLMAVREDREGRLCEKAATRFDLRNPLALKPKTAMVETDFASRAAMPPQVALENVAFEGFLVSRRAVGAVGLPDPSFFIFYDDVDFALRCRRAGFGIRAVRDAVLVRQLAFDQQHDLAGWKGYYMYRNLFVVHLRYGENALVRLKPWLLALGVVVLAPVRGGRAEARNVLRATLAAYAMRRPPPVSVE